MIKDPFLRLTSDRVLGHKQYREGGARGLKEVLNFAFWSSTAQSNRRLSLYFGSLAHSIPATGSLSVELAVECQEPTSPWGGWGRSDRRITRYAHRCGSHP